MRWQNAAAWFGMVALVLPVLIHLFSRRPARVEPFPSLRFITASRILPTRRTRITDIALLMVRLAILALAVAALAAPLVTWDTRNSGLVASSTPNAVVFVDDTLAGVRDSTVARQFAERTAQRMNAYPASTTIQTGAPAAVLPGAVAWLARQPQPHRIVVVSDFRRDALDSLDLAALPAHTSVQLERVTASRTTPRPPQTGVVNWYTSTRNRRGDDAYRAVREAVSRVVVSRGATRLVPESGAALLSSGSTDGTVTLPLRVLVASSDADSMGEWRTTAQALSDAWMGDVAASLHRDTTLISALAELRGIRDTAFTAPFVVIGRSNEDAAIMAVAALPGSDSVSRLLIVSRAPIASVASAALLLAASHAVDGNRFGVANAAFGPDDAALRRWERAPSGTQPATQTAMTVDVFVGPSDGRYVWLLVIALLIAEARLRRHNRAVTAPHAHRHNGAPAS